MPTIAEVKKAKEQLEKTIFDAAKEFEKDGVAIDYIRIDRKYPKDNKGYEVPMESNKHYPIKSVSIDLRIDLD